MLVITNFLEDQAIRAGQAFDSAQRNVISFIVFVSNMFVIGLPVIRTLAEADLTSRAKRAMSLCVSKKSLDDLAPVLIIQPLPEAASDLPSALPIVLGDIAALQVSFHDFARLRLNFLPPS
jgi:hypothetical protein